MTPYGIFDLFPVFLLKTCNRSSLWLSAMVQAWCEKRFLPTLLWIKAVEFKYVILFYVTIGVLLETAV